MNTQSKFLDKEYVATQVRELPEIKKKELRFDITESDRAFSKTIYVNFYWRGLNGMWLNGHTLRISNHSIVHEGQTEFIIDPAGFLSKKVKQRFQRTLHNVIAKNKTKSLHKKLDKLTEIYNDEKYI